MHKLPLVEQAQIASECAIYVTVCGGGAITGEHIYLNAHTIIGYLYSFNQSIHPSTVTVLV